MGYSKNAISGFGWQTVLKIVATLISLGKLMVIARILTPTDFGLFAIIAIALGIAEASTQTGVNLTIIQSKRTVKYFINTAWVIAIIRGLLIGIIMVIMGFAMSKFFNEPSLSVFIAVAALIPIIKGFINPSIVTFHKNLEFFKDGLFRFSLLAVEALLAIIFAIIFKSVIALILSMLGAAIFEVIISFLLFTDRPTFQYIPSRAKLIFNNAKGLSISSLLSYLNQNIDDFLLGRIIGITNLGFYNRAYALAHKATADFARSANHSTLPVYTKIADDMNRLKRAFKKSFAATIVIVLAVATPFLIAPEFFVNIILGEQWISIAPSLYLFIIAGILQSFSILFYTIFYAKKMFKQVNIHLAVTVIILVASIYTLAPSGGIHGAGQALLISRAVTLPILIYSIMKLFRKA